MALWLRDIAIPWGAGEADLPAIVAGELGIDPARIVAPRVIRRSLDARRKGRQLTILTVEFSCADEGGLLQRNAANPRLQPAQPVPRPAASAVRVPHRVLVVGMGPAGLFAALRLAECGVQVTLAERGRPVEQRVRDVERFWRDGQLDSESNVQFGEGGAGTFSDGKLSTRLNHPWLRYVLETLVACGAHDDLLVTARPHIGSDRLRLVLIRFRQRLQSLGVELRYTTRLTGLDTRHGRICAGIVNDAEAVPCDSLLLAPGHSARDTYRMLAARGVALEAKDFAVGVRVEHPRALIDEIQYGRSHPSDLPAAEYALRWNDPDCGRGVYSFCMCPGGEVVNSSSAPGELAVNGMSAARRDGRYSNSALVATVRSGDWLADPLFGGMRLQADLERAAFAAGGGRWLAPAQNLLTFAGQKGGGGSAATCRPGTVAADLACLLPAFVTEPLRRALPHFDRQMRGFVTGEAVLIGVETRTSAPLRIIRGENGESISHPGLFPAGEGAGYAGGIMSAALDGLKAAEAILRRINDGSQA